MTELVVPALLLIAVPVLGWATYCNERTYRERTELVNRVGEQNLKLLREKIPRVYLFPSAIMSYHRHFWMRFVGLNPHDIYAREWTKGPYQMVEKK